MQPNSFCFKATKSLPIDIFRKLMSVCFAMF